MQLTRYTKKSQNSLGRPSTHAIWRESSNTLETVLLRPQKEFNRVISQGKRVGSKKEQESPGQETICQRADCTLRKGKPASGIRLRQVEGKVKQRREERFWREYFSLPWRSKLYSVNSLRNDRISKRSGGRIIITGDVFGGSQVIKRSSNWKPV